MRGVQLLVFFLAAHFFLVVLIPQSQVGLDLVKAAMGVYHEVE